MAEVARRLRSRTGERAVVEVAYLEFLHPSLPEAAERLAAGQARALLVVPYLLGEGQHPREAEALAQQVRRRFPGPVAFCPRGIGAHPLLADLVAERVQEALARAPQVIGPWGILLVKAGTRFPGDSLDWLRTLGEMVQQRLGAGLLTAPAQAGYRPPSLEAAAEGLLLHGVQGLVVVPCLFYPGKILFIDIAPAVERLRARWPAFPVLLAAPMGVDDRLVEIVLERIPQMPAGTGIFQEEASPVTILSGGGLG